MEQKGDILYGKGVKNMIQERYKSSEFRRTLLLRREQSQGFKAPRGEQEAHWRGSAQGIKLGMHP